MAAGLSPNIVEAWMKTSPLRAMIVDFAMTASSLMPAMATALS